ncbi:ACT domain-containing protein [Candidatus Micrarchaeota archaeon]|nr:ACT domain-containing protein [Candidatus Micrarchaeota archaeon]
MKARTRKTSARPVKNQSVSRKVQTALEEKPFLLEALAQGYANLSEAARQMQKQTGGSAEAVRAAIKRYADSKMQKQRLEERQVLGLLRRSTLTLSSKIGMMVIQRTPVTEAKAAHLLVKARAWAKGPSGMSLAVDDEHWDELNHLFGPAEIIASYRDLVALTLVSPPGIVSSPGFVAIVTSRLAREGVNLREFWSAYNDTVMLFDKADAVKAYNLLSNLT